MQQRRANPDIERDLSSGEDAERPNQDSDENDSSGVMQSPKPSPNEESSDEEGLSQYDKTLADSFPSSDPPAQP